MKFTKKLIFLYNKQYTYSIMNTPYYHELNPDIHWSYLSKNPAAIDILKDNLDKVNWYNLSRNPAAVGILKDNLDKVVWMALSENTAPEAIELLKK